MVGQIKTVNGVKKIVPLTAEARAGNPVSTIIAIYSNLVPYGYLPCNGVQFDETQFPALYAILGDNHTPDLRECALVGAGQNATDTIATHDVYNIGEFKDDRVQNHKHSIQGSAGNSPLANIANYLWGDSNRFVEGQGSWESQHSWSILQVGELSTGRTGNTTRGKRKGVNYCIKATAGLDESDADYVLGVLAPVDEVTLNNMHSVTSNAVAQALGSAVVAYEVSSSNTDFIMVRLPTGDYLGLGWNKSQHVVSGSMSGISIATPSGYTLKKLINGDAFAEGNASYVRQAMHSSSGNVYMYLASGTYNAGYIRVQALYSKNS